MKHSVFFLATVSAVVICSNTSCKKTTESVSPSPDPIVIVDTSTADLISLHYSIEQATDWTGLFKRTSGWIGGDGIFSIPLSGVDSINAGKAGKTLLLFSDTQLGEIENGVLSGNSHLIHNSVAIIDGNEPEPSKINFYWKNVDGNPVSVFVPNTPLAVKEDFFWLGDGFVNSKFNNETNILAYKIRNVNTSAGFALAGSSIISIPAGSEPPFSDATQMDSPLFVEGDKIDNGYAFGAGIFVNTKEAGAPHPDGYVYVYGVKPVPGFLNKGLMVARVLPENFKDFSQWKFWDGQEWSLDIHHIKNAFVITDRVSDELSLTPLPDGRYVLVFQADVWGSVALRIAKTPAGPFGPVIPVWDCKEALTGKDYFAYNAKAHPNLSKTGELLISFNVNSFNYFNDLQSDPNLYRPRFLRLKFK